MLTLARNTRKQIVGKKAENERICEGECLLEEIQAELHREWREQLQREGVDAPEEGDEEFGSEIERL